MSILGAAIAAAAAAALKSQSGSKSGSSGSSSSSGGSSKKTSSTSTRSGGGTSGGYNANATDKYGKTTADYSREYEAAKARGDTAGMNAAHAAAEAIRNSQGYTGGDDGSQISRLPSSGSGSSKQSSSGSSGSSSSSGLPSYQGRPTGGSGFYDSPYDPNTDYQALINDAVRNGDYATAAVLEQARNQKIISQGLNYETTNLYSQYLGQARNPGVSSIYDGNGKFTVSPTGPNGSNTGAGVGVTTVEGSYLGGGSQGLSPLYQNWDIQAEMDKLAEQLAGYEKALETETDPKWIKWYQEHLVGGYRQMAEYEVHHNNKLQQLGRGNEATYQWQDWNNNAGGWKQYVSAVGNGANQMSASQIAGYERQAKTLENAFFQADSDEERELIWRDWAPIELALGRAWDPVNQRWTVTTVNPVIDYYGTGKDGSGDRSYGSWTNGAVVNEADAAVLAQELARIKQERDDAAESGIYDPGYMLEHGGKRLEGADTNLTYNGLTEGDYKALYDQYKARGDAAGMAWAHAGAEAIRAKNGYSGGEDGSQVIKLGSGQTAQTPTQQGSSLESTIMGLPGVKASGLVLSAGLAGLAGAALAGSGSQSSGMQSGISSSSGFGGSSSGGSGEYDIPSGGNTGGSTGGGTDTGYTSGQGSMLDRYNEAYDRYLEQMNSAQDASKQQVELGVQQAINNLNAQRGDIEREGQQANAAAEKLYMDSINPNGAIANQLSAMGLRDSGLTETSIIDAGNTLQNNLQENNRVVADQLAKIDLAVTNAELEGNIQIAGILAEYGQAVAQMGMNHAGQVLSFEQWATEFEETKRYNDAQLAMAQQQLAMQEAQLRAQQEQAAWERQMAQQQWEYQQQQDALDRQMQQEQWDWQKQQASLDREQQAYENRYANQQANRELLMQQMAQGVYPSHDMIVAAGWNDTDAYNTWKAIRKNLGLT